MKKLYEKSEFWFAILWIVIYSVMISVGDNLSKAVGITSVFTFPILAVISVVLFIFVKKNDLLEKYGLCKTNVPASKMLFYIPMLAILSVNLWFGAALNVTPLETLFYILAMLCVGFIEEILFRGFLFKAIINDSKITAIIISSVTFGLGHILQLINGSGVELIPNLLNVAYAIGIGFVFVMVFYKSGSLIPCIITHSLFDALSAFANEGVITMKMRVISSIILVAIESFYAIYLALSGISAKKQQ